MRAYSENTVMVVMDKVLILPIETDALPKETYSHYIFRHRLDGLGTFIGEVLISIDLFAQKYMYKGDSEVRVQPRLFLNDMPEAERQKMIRLREELGRTDEVMQATSWFCEEPIPTPEIVWRPRKERQNLCGDLLRGTFYAAITQLVSTYEIFLEDIAREIYRCNISLLADEKKPKEELLILTSLEIVQLADYDNVIEALMNRAINRLSRDMSYPKLVGRFQNAFHVGIHDQDSPIQQIFPVHHLIEKRNIIVHNDGQASLEYVEKMKIYNDSSILKKDEEVPVDFQDFYNHLSMIREIGKYIELCVQSRWTNLSYITCEPLPTSG